MRSIITLLIITNLLLAGCASTNGPANNQQAPFDQPPTHHTGMSVASRMISPLTS